MSDDFDEIRQCVVEHNEEKEKSVKSQAIVKHQMVKSVANFAQLQCNTNLNIPPSNWLNSNINSYGLQQALSQSTGFSSFLMAHLFPDCVGEVDVVANAENIKRLLKLPYSPNSSISMMVHRIENTILIDEFDIHKYLLRQTDDNWPWLRSFIYENIMSSLGEFDHNFFLQNNNVEATQQRSLLSKFLYHSISRTDEGTSPRSSPNREHLDVNLLRPSLIGPPLPEPNVEENVPDPDGSGSGHTFNRNCVWTFEDIRMLIGTDMAIFGGNSRPCISLRLREMSEPINVLTGIDYWLDNLMCNVPEVVMCYHLDGLVQKYEIIKTEDLPYLENSEFSPKVIRNVAQNILSFLKQNATKSGHTYWLFKGRNDEVVKLYDLTSLCMKEDNCSAPATATKGPTKDEKDNKNPFTVPVAMLLYNVARNMKNSSSHISAKQAGSIKNLLDNCIKLLPKEKYPQIVTSSYYLLADLHVPTGIDPISPNFGDDSESDTHSVYDDERYNSDCDGTIGGSSTNGDDSFPDQMTDNVAVKNLNELNVDKNWKHNSCPPPISSNVEERCFEALENIIQGLSCLQYFSSTEEKLTKEREEIAKQEERIRIIHEEQNPNMARSYQAIPLPYENLQPKTVMVETMVDSSTETKTNKSKKSKRNRKKSQSAQNNAIDSNLAKSQSLLLKPTGVIYSWNVHLKLLLLEKACLTYAILAEQAYQNVQYGNALKFISLAIKIQNIVTKYKTPQFSQQTCLLGRAGDCLFQCAQNFQTIQEHLDAYRDERDIDLLLIQELQKDCDAIVGDIFLPLPTDSIEELNLSSIVCYETALKYATKGEAKHELIGRKGSVQNELGVRYMHWSQAEYRKALDAMDAAESETETATEKADNETENATNALAKSKGEKTKSSSYDYVMLATKSYDCLVRGIAAFEQIGDDANLAILLSNMGRFMRFRGHLDEENATFSFKKKCYDSAFTYYQRALGILDTRKQNPNLWDWVTWELSTSKFTLGQHMYEYFGDDMTDEIEQEVIELLFGSLKLCDTETPTARQILYIIRTGLIFRRLGNIYFASYQSEIVNDVRRKKLLHLCRLYFEKSTETFQSIDAPIEYLNVQIDRLAVQDFLIEGSQNNSQKGRHLQSSLSMLYSSAAILDQVDKAEFDKTDKTTIENAKSAFKQFELKLQLILKKSIKFCLTKSMDNENGKLLKDLYSMTLRAPKGDEDALNLVQHLKPILEKLEKIVIE